MLDILSDPRHDRAGGVVTTPEEMPVNETLELADAGREPRPPCELAAVVVNRVLPELFGRGEEEVFEQLREPGRPRTRSSERGRRPGGARCSRRPAWPSPCGAPAPAHLERLRAGLDPRRARAATCPTCSPAAHGAAHDPPGGRRRSARSWATDGRRQRARSRARQTSLDRLLAAKEIVIACGPGGVGKTTTAAAAAAMAAVEHGGKVLVLTVDPARRLADALGLEGHRQRREPRPRRGVHRPPASRPRGELWAAMLDTKQSWDDLIRRARPRRGDPASEILANPLYQNISGRFVQSHDYIAMERLYEIHSEGNYDLIVVDTPPTRNALDFLDAPAAHGRLLLVAGCCAGSSCPTARRLVNVASKPFYQVADRILGTQFLDDISEFFILFQSMYDGLRRAGRGGDPAAVGPAHHLHGRVDARGRRRCARRSSSSAELDRRASCTSGPSCSTRCCPTTCATPKTAKLAAVDATTPAPTELADGPDRRPRRWPGRRVLGEVAESFLNFRVVARREAEQQAELRGAPDVLVTVPFFDTDIYDLAGLLRLGEQVWD